MGADDSSKCELEPQALAQADLIVVDSREAAASNGSTMRALQAGALAETDLTEIGQIGAYQRDPNAVTIACLVGIGIQDLVAAETALAIIQQAEPRLSGASCTRPTSPPPRC